MNVKPIGNGFQFIGNQGKMEMNKVFAPRNGRTKIKVHEMQLIWVENVWLIWFTVLLYPFSPFPSFPTVHYSYKIFENSSFRI